LAASLKRSRARVASQPAVRLREQIQRAGELRVSLRRAFEPADAQLMFLEPDQRLPGQEAISGRVRIGDSTEFCQAGIGIAAGDLPRRNISPPKPLNSRRMTKQQLVEKVAAKTELGMAEATVAVDSVLHFIGESLRSNERVDLRGFGSFVVKERKARQGRNPRTGETITIAAKRDASFKPGKELTEKLAQGETPVTSEEAK